MRTFFVVFLFLACVLLVFPQTMNAQSGKIKIGFSAGGNINKLHTKTTHSFSKYESKAGFSVSIPMQYLFLNWLAVRWDLSCLQKNYTWSHKDRYQEVLSTQTTQNTYIQIPLLLHFSLGKKQFKIFANAGGFGGFLVSRKANGTILNVFDPLNNYHYDEKSEFDKRRDRRFEFGLATGLGLEYFIKNQYRVFIEARYFYACTDLQKKYMINQTPRYNDTFLFQAGCLFNLSNIKK